MYNDFSTKVVAAQNAATTFLHYNRALEHYPFGERQFVGHQRVDDSVNVQLDVLLPGIIMQRRIYDPASF